MFASAPGMYCFRTKRYGHVDVILSLFYGWTLSQSPSRAFTIRLVTAKWSDMR